METSCDVELRFRRYCRLHDSLWRMRDWWIDLWRDWCWHGIHWRRAFCCSEDGEVQSLDGRDRLEGRGDVGSRRSTRKRRARTRGRRRCSRSMVGPPPLLPLSVSVALLPLRSPPFPVSLPHLRSSALPIRQPLWPSVLDAAIVPLERHKRAPCKGHDLMCEMHRRGGSEKVGKK